MKTLRLLGFLLGVLLALVVCVVTAAEDVASPTPEVQNAERKIVAEVNGEPIYLEDLERVWNNLPEAYRTQFPGGIKDLLEQFIRQVLLLQEARKAGLESDPEILRQIEEVKKQILIREIIKREIIDKVQVSEEEIQKEYNANPTQYTEPEQVKARHIMVSSREKAEAILAELQAGRPFEEVAREKSESPDALSGGSMGYIKRGDLDPELEKVLFELAPGNYSDIVEINDGFHIFFVEEHIKPRLKELSEVKEEIIARLTPQKQQEAFERWIEALKSKAEIAIIEENLPSGESKSSSQ
ncbi:MAG: peptidyl-prolyl cis-trans isomerase [Candidatus Caldatribacterium sp.]|uniref:peptidylprolyl isomerase n=1 Tax=Candidatus Caldatribacterium sp. TaxID=2282143 RepID=UPI002995CB3B|nr:peptidyl-prolyl cis-trans isomerase [Candidatus Caldatribacterium sp.]MCX7729877.1 peptidyl-prolyl cis-trans isomerase [Candidatus Caldatribacterium sp.]MDW8080669.1 peptidyl-prolyl cis-trans isomerase [Candidatus Calescibacterium sp.]